MKHSALQVLFYLCAAVFVLAALSLGSSLYSYHKGAEIYADINRTAIKTPAAMPESAELAWQPPQVDFAVLTAINPQIIGWLAIENTTISYPLLQGSDNQFYTQYAANKERSKAGSIFLDYRSSARFTDRNSVIYGHNQKNGAMFNGLSAYLDETYWPTHATIYLLLPDQTLIYRVFAAYRTDAASDSYLLSFANDEAFAAFLEEIAQEALVYEPLPADSPQTILTLSTCTNRSELERYVVHAYPIKPQI